MDRALGALYNTGDDAEDGGGRRGGLGASAPSVTRWLGDIRNYFPSRVVRVMQTDAIERLGVRSLLTEPEVLETLEPDVHLVATLAQLEELNPKLAKDPLKFNAPQLVTVPDIFPSFTMNKLRRPLLNICNNICSFSCAPFTSC